MRFILSVICFNQVALFGQSPPKAATATPVVNAASFSSPVAPGSLATFFGSNLAQASQSAQALPLPTSLGGVSILINGILAPIQFVSANQINFQIPYETPSGSASVVAINPQGRSDPTSVVVAPVALGMFAFGSNRSVSQNADYTLNSPDHAAKPGSVIVCYLTGGGEVTNPVPDGFAARSDILSYVKAQPATAAINNVPAQVLFAGLTPGFVGLLQVDVVVPSMPAGDYGLTITMGSSTSQNRTLTVGQSIDLPPGSGTTPTVRIESPTGNSNVSGAIVVSGYIVNDGSVDGADPVTSVRVFLNGALSGYATYGIPRPDICASYPGRPNCPGIGFTYQLSLSSIANTTAGRIQVLANDSSTPPLTGSAEVPVSVAVPLVVTPNPLSISIGASEKLYANRSVYWSQPSLGKVIVGDSTYPLPPGVPASTATYIAPMIFSVPSTSFTVTDAQDSSQKMTVPVNFLQGADLAITKTHNGNFTRGGTGVYTVTVSNASKLYPSAGSVTVTESLPGGLTLESISGSGWSCVQATCSRSDILSPATSYPALTVRVNVLSSATYLQVNQVTVAGGGSRPTSATDPVNIQ